jgi:WD40 repeat protein
LQVTDFFLNCSAFHQHKKAIVGTLKGMVKIYECESGELIESFQAHKNEISSIVIDYENQILTTSSFDSQILIWKETAKGLKSI